MAPKSNKFFIHIEDTRKERFCWGI